MAKCYVFKNQSGLLVGYMEQRQTSVIYSVHLDCAQCEVLLVFGDGSVECKRMNQDTQEGEWEIKDFRALLGGCIVCGERVYAESGTGIRDQAFKAWSRRIQPSKQDEPNLAKETVTPQVQQNQGTTGQRWPPNPCCPEDAL